MKKEYNQFKKKEIAIIGSGPNAFGFLIGLLKQIEEHPDHHELVDQLSLHIFEKSSIVGAGFPYDGSMFDPEHLLNVQTISPSIPDFDEPLKANTEGFLKWLRENKETIEKKTGDIFRERLAKKFKTFFGKEYDAAQEYEDHEKELCEHYDKLFESFKKRYLNFESGLVFHPRVLYGLYQVVLFEKILTKLRKCGVEITTHLNSEVVGLDKDLNLEYVEAGEKNGESKKFDKVIIASGRFYEEQKDVSESYIQNPWPARNLKEKIDSLISQKIRKRQQESNGDKVIRIAIEGSRLSAIDVVKTIFQDGIVEEENGNLIFKPYPREDGYQIKIDMISRSGFLQTIEGNVASGKEVEKFKITQKDIDELQKDQNGNIHLWQIMNMVAQRLGVACQELEVALPDQLGNFLKLIELQQNQEPLNYGYVLEFLKEVSKQDAISGLKENLKNATSQTLNFYQIFQAIYKPVDGLDIASKMPLHERIFFKEFMLSAHLTQVVRMPPQSAKELIAFSEAGVLDVLGMGSNIKRSITDEGKISFSGNTDSGNTKIVEYDIVISSRGHPSSIGKNPSRLYQSMIENGVISSSDFEIGNEEKFSEFKKSLSEKFGSDVAESIAGKIKCDKEGIYYYEVGSLNLEEYNPVDDKRFIHEDIIFLTKTSGIGTAIKDSTKAAEKLFFDFCDPQEGVKSTSSLSLKQPTIGQGKE